MSVLKGYWNVFSWQSFFEMNDGGKDIMKEVEA